MVLPLRYCQRCCMPETQDGQAFDDMGFCNVCRSAEQKMRINWMERRSALERILENAREENKDNPYDCLIPISGGKDSTFQLHVLVKEYGMRPLAVTFSHNWFNSTGVFNLLNSLEQFDVDHLMFTPKRTQVNKLAKKSLSEIGDACWHCHAGVGAFPLRMALEYDIKLIIWGESAAESSSRGTYKDPIMKFDQDYFEKVSAKVSVDKMADTDLPLSELSVYQQPDKDTYSLAGIQGIHLGDYIFWDEERQTEFVKETYGWKETNIEGTYKRYKSAECIMPGVHDFACYLKRGYGRASFHASNDVRAGLVTREEAFEELVPMDQIEPNALSYYSKITGITREEFIDIVGSQKHESLIGVELPIVENPNKDNSPKLFIEDLKRWIEQNDQ
jgi:N-acetyl sugar amidotransferase